MSSSPATVAASRMMSYSTASLQHLTRSHLRPIATAAAAAIELTNNASGSLLPLSELGPFMRSCIAQDFAASEIRSRSGEPQIQFRFGLAAERFKDQSRIEVRGGPINIDDEVNNSDDDEEEEEGDFDESDGDYFSDKPVGEKDPSDDSASEDNSDFYEYNVDEDFDNIDPKNDGGSRK